METDAGMLPPVKSKGKDEAALGAAGLTSASSTSGTGTASSTGSSTGSNIRCAEAAAAALRRSVSPAAAAAASGDAGGDIAGPAAAAEQLVPPPLQEGDEGMYTEEDGGKTDVGLFLDSTADDGTSAVNGRRRDLGAVMTSSCPPSGEDPNDWVDCFEGKVRGTDTYCDDACGDDCCNGIGACDYATACIKKDGSCGEGSLLDGACYFVGYGSSYQLQISGPSCVGDYACSDMFKDNPNAGGIVSLTNSCTCDYSCHTSLDKLHCSGDSPAPLPGLPACGDPFDNVGGQSSSSCAVSCSVHFPFSHLSIYLDPTHSAKYS